MSNMSYCRFENTYNDLQDCYEALDEAGSIENVSSGQYDKPYVKKLVDLCKKIADEYGG